MSRRKYKGPALKIGLHDFVPGLVCSAPFPCMKDYMQRSRQSRWPPQKSLEDTASIPGIIVPTEIPINPIDTDEWRYSFSPQELRLAQDMTDWVKLGYRALKYTCKSLYQRKCSATGEIKNGHNVTGPILSKTVIRSIIFRLLGWVPSTKAENGRKHVSSYHMKTVLLWSLEREFTWQEECSFRLMILLLRKLADHLAAGVLPHYFNPSCNLLQNISREELDSARSCLDDILSDPVQSVICAPNDSREIKKVE